MEIEVKENSRIRACIIGAGAAGLCAARHLAELESKFVFDVYEQTDKVGGTWNYTQYIGCDSNGLSIHTSMYKNMRTNIPMELMEFPDFPSNCCTSFVHHSQVLEYLESYAKHFQLIQYIKFKHQIIQVSRFDNSWKVKVSNLETGVIEEKTYDSIFVCNGRYAKPKIPNKEQMKGIEKFKGKIIHSHDYRVPEIFSDQTVLILGAGPSGVDISIEISKNAKQVLLCHQLNEPHLGLPNNIIQEMTQIKQISESKVEFENGNQYERVDTIIFATGYECDYNFLDKSCEINVNSYGRVEGIYLHFINTSYPSMAIWGVVKRVLPFQIYNQQVLFFIKYLNKELLLPSKTEMESEIQTELLLRKSMGLTEKYAHVMNGQLFRQYSDKLSKMAQILPLKPVVIQMHNDMAIIRKNDLIGYKDMKFHIISDNNYIIKD